MKYDHVVKANGEYYAAGQELPEAIKREEKEPTFSDSDITFDTEPVRRGRPKKNG